MNLPHVRKSALTLFAFLCCFSLLQAQDKKKTVQLHPELNVYYQAGGLINSDNFVFRNGIGINAAAHFKFHNKVYYGIGMGYEQLGSEHAVPIYLEVKAFLKKSKSSAFFTGQLGYAFVWNDNLANYNSYESIGGILISPGVGYKLTLSNKQNLMFSVHYKNQYAKIKYETVGKEFEDKFTYNLLVFKIGYLF